MLRKGEGFSSLTASAFRMGNGWSAHHNDNLTLKLGRLIRSVSQRDFKTASLQPQHSPAASDECKAQFARRTAERCCPIGMPHYQRDEFLLDVLVGEVQQHASEITPMAVSAFELRDRTSLLERASMALAQIDSIIKAAKGQSSVGKHDMLSKLLHACASGRVMFIDCETLGFGSMPIFLIGALEWLRELRKVTLHQWLAHDYSEEPLIIEAFLNMMSGCVLVSFNGRAFDIPMLRSRSVRYKLAWVEPTAHVDLFHISRKLWSGQFSNCRLSTLCIAMNHPVSMPPSSLLPELYCQFVESHSDELRESLLLHNAVDVCALPVLLHAVLRSIMS